MNIRTWQERAQAVNSVHDERFFMREEIQELRAALASFVFAGTASGMPGTNDGFTMTAFDGDSVPPGTNVYIRKD